MSELSFSSKGSLVTGNLFVQSMIDDTITKATAHASSNQRLSIMTIALASMAFLLVITSVAAFIYITRKGN